MSSSEDLPITRREFAQFEKHLDRRFDGMEKATATAFASSEKAIEKSETAQKQYNDGHNDLLKKMDAQYDIMLPRTEAITRFERNEADIVTLKRIQTGQSESKLTSDRIIAWLIAAGAVASAIIVAALK